jgi:hypothetical protein
MESKIRMSLPSSPVQYLEVRSPGLEVGEDPYRSPHTGWPDAANPVWGLSSTDTTSNSSNSSVKDSWKSPLLPQSAQRSLSNTVSAAPKTQDTISRLLVWRRGGNEDLTEEVEGKLTAGTKRMLGVSRDVMWQTFFMLGCLVVFGGLGGIVGWALGRRGCGCKRYDIVYITWRK